METFRNDTLAKLDDGEPVRGAWLASMSPRVAEVLARTDLDWVGLDAEHTPASAERIESAVRAIGDAATPVVRLPSVEAAVDGVCKRALDSGVQGVMIPDVRTPEDVERAVGAAKFPPAGERGVAGTTRANGYGAAFDEYVERANDETLVAIQLESREVIERADELLAVEGVDVAFVGENDLSASLGHPGETDRSDVVEAVDAVFEAAQTNGVHPGIAGRTPEDIAERADRGFRFFLLGADVKFLRDGLEPFFSG
ncbi:MULTISPECIES: HpcH/HpaI aldolase family protein [Halorussus]|uniref:HpcH/HpaI aldolase family protein n=1 Tax=Halorussus TaxID=1070314 RepID=UPI00209FD0F5|nr:aldolase/citrate lyase family protein [Halorussus vallis]USZ76738.1 aldolase/citrate lyase family protein [Halorussus vallis]